MKIWDISVTLKQDMLIFPGDKKFKREKVASIREGNVCNMSKLEMGAHNGTHVDAPFHFVEGGKSIDQVPLNKFYGPVQVVDLSAGPEAIGESDLADHVKEGIQKVLFRTRASDFVQKKPFRREFPHLTKEAADYLVESGVDLVGIDYLTIERLSRDNHPVHKHLLKNGVIILEGLNLKEVEAGDYILACFPLKIKGGDGSPCRAVLMEP